MKRVLSFLNLLDNGGGLSLTNLAMYIGLFKLATAAQLGGGDVAALLGVFGNYCHKRFVNDGATE